MLPVLYFIIVVAFPASLVRSLGISLVGWGEHVAVFLIAALLAGYTFRVRSKEGFLTHADKLLSLPGCLFIASAAGLSAVAGSTTLPLEYSFCSLLASTLLAVFVLIHGPVYDWDESC